jgi:hypothetical protein
MVTTYEAEHTEAQIEDVAKALHKAWMFLLGERPSRASIILLLAQGALETGRWKSMYCWNLGNIKAGKDVDHCYFRCNEVLSQKAAAEIHMKSTPGSVEIGRAVGSSVVVWFNPPHPYCRFRAYATLDDGAVGYLDMLHRRFKASWAQVLIGDPVEFVRALKKENYFTADVVEYSKSVASLFNEFHKKLQGVAFEEDAVVSPNATTLEMAAVDLTETAKDMVAEDGAEYNRRDSGE